MPRLQNNIITLENVSLHKENKLILDNLTLSIPRDKATAIVGPKGVGKTMLLYLISGVIKPDKGKILINEKNIHNLNNKEQYTLREKIGFFFQQGALFSDLNVYENIAFPLRLRTNLSEDMMRDIVLLNLEIVGMREAINLMPSDLSPSSTQLISLARTIVLEPALILYDIPFYNQNLPNIEHLVERIKKINKILNVTSVITSDNLDHVTNMVEYIYCFNKGRIIEQGTPAEIMAKKTSILECYSHSFIQESNPLDKETKTIEEDFLGYANF